MFSSWFFFGRNAAEKYLNNNACMLSSKQERNKLRNLQRFGFCTKEKKLLGWWTRNKVQVKPSSHYQTPPFNVHVFCTLSHQQKIHRRQTNKLLSALTFQPCLTQKYTLNVIASLVHTNTIVHQAVWSHSSCSLWNGTLANSTAFERNEKNCNFPRKEKDENLNNTPAIFETISHSV